MRITSIQQAKKNENRVNLFLDNVYWTSLDKNELLELGLKKDIKISESDKNNIEKISSEGKVYSKALDYAYRRPRSVKEMRDYLKFKRQVEEELSESIIAKLKSKNILSDEQFTDWYIQQRLSFGIHGIEKIKGELVNKGVSTQIISDKLSQLTSIESFENEQIEKAIKFIQKHIKERDKEDAHGMKQKIYRKLAYRGFSGDIIRKVIKILTSNSKNNN